MRRVLELNKFVSQVQKDNSDIKEAMKLLKEDSDKLICTLEERIKEAKKIQHKTELSLKDANSKLKEERKEVSKGYNHILNSL